MEREAKIIPTDNPGHNPGHQAGNPKYPIRNIPSPGTYLLGHYADGSLDLIRVKGLPEGTDEQWHLEVECPNIEPDSKGHHYLTPAVLVDMTRRANDEDFQAFIIEQKQSLMDVRKTYKGDPGGMVDWFRRGIDVAYEWWKEFRDKRGIDPPPPLSQVAPKGQRTLFGNPPAAPPPPEVPAAAPPPEPPAIQKDETEPVFIGQDWECFKSGMEYTEAIKLEEQLREAGRTVRKEPRGGKWDVYIRKWDTAAAPPPPATSIIPWKKTHDTSGYSIYTTIIAPDIKIHAAKVVAHYSMGYRYGVWESSMPCAKFVGGAANLTEARKIADKRIAELHVSIPLEEPEPQTLDEYIGIQKEETAVPQPPKEKQKTLEQYLNGG